LGNFFFVKFFLKVFLDFLLKRFLETIFSAGKILKKILCGLDELFFADGQGGHENIFKTFF